MKVIIDRAKLIDVMSKSLKLIKPNEVIMILGGVLLSAKESTMELLFGDGNNVCSASVACTVEEDGELIVNAKLLLNLLKTIPADSVVLEQKKKDSKLSIINGKNVYKLAITGKREDFIGLPQLKDTAQVSILAKDFYSSLSKVNFLVADVGKDHVMSISGVFVECRNNRITMVGTDSTKMGISSFVVEPTHDFSFVIPEKTVSQLSAIFDSIDFLKVDIADNFIRVSDDTFVVYLNLLVNKYPNYGAVVPKTDSEMEINRNDFIRALERAILLSSGAYVKSVNLNSKKSGVLEVSQNNDNGDTTDLIQVSDSPTMRIIASAENLLLVLKHMQDEKIRMKYSQDKNATFVICPTSEKDNTTYIITSLVVR